MMGRVSQPGNPPAVSLQAALQSGTFTVTAEIGPPRSADPDAVRRKVEALRGWVTAVNLTDNQSAMARMANWAASLLAQDVGVPPIMQLTCRDRNRIMLQSELLAAGAMGIPNIVAMTGDHPRFGDHPDAKPVFDLDSVGLLATARTMRDEGRLMSGRSLSVPPRWFLGAVENPFAPPTAFRAARLGKKIAAGAQFVQTQYVFDVAAFERWLTQVADLGLLERCYVLAGVGPVMSVRALDHLQHRVPGIYVPGDVARRLLAVPASQTAEEGMKLCAETIAELRQLPGLAGIHVIATGNEHRIPELLQLAGLAPTAPAPTGPAPSTAGAGRAY